MMASMNSMSNTCSTDDLNNLEVKQASPLRLSVIKDV